MIQMQPLPYNVLGDDGRPTNHSALEQAPPQQARIIVLSGVQVDVKSQGEWNIEFDAEEDEPISGLMGTERSVFELAAEARRLRHEGKLRRFPE